MLAMDIKMPKTCQQCICSCVMPSAVSDNTWDGSFYKILCRGDFREHKPGDETCLIKGEVKEDSVRKIYPLPEEEEIEDGESSSNKG